MTASSRDHKVSQDMCSRERHCGDTVISTSSNSLRSVVSAAVAPFISCQCFNWCQLWCNLSTHGTTRLASPGVPRKSLAHSLQGRCKGLSAGSCNYKEVPNGAKTDAARIIWSATKSGWLGCKETLGHTYLHMAQNSGTKENARLVVFRGKPFHLGVQCG